MEDDKGGNKYGDSQVCVTDDKLKAVEGGCIGSAVY